MFKLKIIQVVLFSTCLFVSSILAQNLRTVKTWYDPYTQTKIKELYTTLPNPPYKKNGVYKSWDEQGYKISEENYTNGERNGIYKLYYTGIIAEQRLLDKVFKVQTYKNGILNGADTQYEYHDNGIAYKTIESFYSNGDKMKEVRYFSNGKIKSSIALNGPCIEYFDNGKLQVKYNKKDGANHGSYIEYFEDGKLAVKAKYFNGEFIDTAIMYHDNSKVMTFQYVNPKTLIIDVYKMYYPSGKPKFDRTLVANNLFKVSEWDSLQGYLSSSYNQIQVGEEGEFVNDGKSQYFLANGKSAGFTNYKAGIKVGETKRFDENGIEMLSGQYFDDKRVGKWKIQYSKDSSIAKSKAEITHFRNIEFDSSGIPVGQVKDFFVTGQKKWEGYLSEFDPEKIIGEYTFYFKNGKIEEENKVDEKNNSSIKTTYYENGNPREVYKIQVSFINYEKYNNMGTLIESGDLTESDGNIVKDGEWSFYDDNGKLLRKESFAVGIKTGSDSEKETSE